MGLMVSSASLPQVLLLGKHIAAAVVCLTTLIQKEQKSTGTDGPIAHKAVVVDAGSVGRKCPASSRMHGVVADVARLGWHSDSGWKGNVTYPGCHPEPETRQGADGGTPTVYPEAVGTWQRPDCGPQTV